jgi:squalene synthase HpnC
MSETASYKSGKSERDENFPVASHLIAARYRGPILAYYRFARAADDAADHATLSEADKFAILASLEDTLLGRSDAAADALPLRRALAETGLAPTHALELLAAFRQDVTKKRYSDWDDLMDYCRYSAMPVGRFVLDVHGEPKSTWGPSDALCAALQVINHLQDCAKDYRNLDRVYLPLDTLSAHATGVEALAAPRASPGLRGAIRALADKTLSLMPAAGRLPREVRDLRLSAETATIAALADKLIALLLVRDPLSERVHLSKMAMLAIAARATAGVLSRRMTRPATQAGAARGNAP